jgi:hypothetical protein
MSEDELDTLLQFFKALGNESRLKIIGLLAVQERSVGELAEIISLKEPTISHHLAMMRKLDLVKVRAEGTVRIYRLEAKTLETMSRTVFSENMLSSLVNEDLEDTRERKVLKAFVDGDRIKTLPARQKKRLVVLRWLVNQLEYDVSYPEAELNELLKRYHSDYASLRRYLVNHGLMGREKGVYRRTDRA